MFTNVIGYDMPVISGVTNSRERLAIAAGCEFSDIEGRLRDGLDRPIEPEFVNTGPAREVYLEGDDVDLYSMPVPLFSVLDGCHDYRRDHLVPRSRGGRELGRKCRRLPVSVKEKNLTGIDIVTPNNLHRYAAKAYEKGEPLPISINIGTHPFELICSTYKARAGVSELGIAGGMRGKGVPLTQCQTIDMPCIADAEIVLEAEILPTGWTQPEGRFGEFTRLMGGLHWNPHVRIKAVSMRKNPVYYALHMPWENIWPSGPIYEANVRRVLDEAGVNVTAVNITPGGCCHWHAIVRITTVAGRRQECHHRCVVGGGHEARHCGQSRYRRIRSRRCGMGGCNPGTSRPGRGDHFRRKVQTARPQPAASGAVFPRSDHGEDGHRCDDPG